MSSCETVVTDELDIPNSTPLLVVEGGIERFDDGRGTVTEIKLSTTAPYLDQNETPKVENAIVSTASENQTVILNSVSEGVFTTEKIEGEIGKSYTLRILWNDYEYIASDIMNQAPPIDTLYSIFQEESGITDEGYFLNFNSQDPAGIANQYHYRVFKEGEYIILPDPGNARTLVLTDEFFDGAYREGINPNEEAVFEPGQIGKVEQMGISMAYYQFLFQVYDQTGNQGLSFTGNPPPASIRGNLIATDPDYPRALGFFHVADIATAETVVLP